MPRVAIGLAAIGLLTVFTASTVQRGCQDLVTSNLHWSYFPYRDMRTSVAVTPQKVMLLAPDPGSVPVGGLELPVEEPPYEQRAQRLTNPVPVSDSSLARGARLVGRLCTPCHGKTLVGDGPVIPNYMPPPDLLGEQTRQRSDGYIYSYIRFGGVVMPSYGAQLTAEQAWNVVNYLRHMQRTAPR